MGIDFKSPKPIYPVDEVLDKSLYIKVLQHFWKNRESYRSISHYCTETMLGSNRWELIKKWEKAQKGEVKYYALLRDHFLVELQLQLQMGDVPAPNLIHLMKYVQDSDSLTEDEAHKRAFEEAQFDWRKSRAKEDYDIKLAELKLKEKAFLHTRALAKLRENREQEVHLIQVQALDAELKKPEGDTEVVLKYATTSRSQADIKAIEDSVK